MALLKKRKRERKWTGAVNILGVSKEEAERRFWLAYKKSFIEPILKLPPKERIRAVKEWMEGVKDRTEEMAHEEVRPYRKVRTEQFSKMSDHELETKLVETVERLKRVEKRNNIYDPYFAVFVEEDMNVIKDILAKRKRQ